MAFVVAATWTAKPGSEEHIEQIIKIMTPLSRAEEHNLYYQAQVSPEAPGVFFLYEQYTDEAGYEVHKATTHFQQHVFGDAIEHLANREVKTFRTIDV
jgi:quinol monooxygenase YgiN